MGPPARAIKAWIPCEKPAPVTIKIGMQQCRIKGDKQFYVHAPPPPKN